MMCSCIKATRLLLALSATGVDALVSTHVVPEDMHGSPAPSSMRSMKNSRTRDLPQGKQVAIILRGETFRYSYRGPHRVEHRKPCAEQGKDLQMNTTRSVLEKIILPLEHNGNHIEVFFTTLTPTRTRFPTLEKPGNTSTTYATSCPLDNLVVSAFQANPSRVVKVRSFATTGQADTILKVLHSFNDDHGGVTGVGNTFDYIMLMRNDLMWFKPIDTIHVDFSKVNALSRCEQHASRHFGGPFCVHDSFWMMPGSLYKAVTSAFGHRRCFDPREDPKSSGHLCQLPIRRACRAAGHIDAFVYLENGHRIVRPEQPVSGGNGQVAGGNGHVADVTYMPSH